MRHQKFLGFALAGVIALGSVGCSVDSFLDVNANPNNPEIVPPTVLLTNVLITTGFSNGNEINRITSLLVQHMAGTGTQSIPQDRYEIRGGLDNQWQFEIYAGSLENSKQLIDAAARTNSPSYAGIAKLLKAYNFAMTTDLWGDIPYSEALQGLNKLQPRFDKQEDIYKGNSALGIQSLDALVKEGLDDLSKPSALNPTNADDPVYAGDLAKWRRMGNTLRLKLANTISRKEPALAKAIIDEVITGNNYIASNADDFQVPFGGAVGNRNPLADYNGLNVYNPNTATVTASLTLAGQRPTDLLLSQRLLDTMRVNNDPRLPIYFNPTANNASATVTTLPGATAGTFLYFTGIQNGSNINVGQLNRSKYNTYFTGSAGEAPIRLITNFQRLFIMAESALILGTSTGGAGNTVQSLYRDAIRASMTKAGLTSAQVDAYFTANPNVANLRGSQQQQLNQIITQKWIAWVGNSYEAYNDYRRTGYPRLALAQNASGDNPNVLPRRFVYPTSESAGNANNTPNPVPGTTANVWWDVRPL
ncbi:SusD/RagB family nutrient-binding outer membrane lipoprotein [Hymenobacter sp. BT523]|uniref:SusD/RagB family nutrient-binding outer membrane lipoprotein n=1 Tax=Hymenobacter sp. BT523 TaxID=2795725 RepID=UPI0018EC3400|nr:SusD/RagB family nutrient-binding outer membrane lipoprotein [Hymenobacter sp. BT523]MBJ6110093.1 SusD/RagB family nutrient-binding outer membrane lipoprotein [Hymenobacter sp. BT523]